MQPFPLIETVTRLSGYMNRQYEGRPAADILGFQEPLYERVKRAGWDMVRYGDLSFSDVARAVHFYYFTHLGLSTIGSPAVALMALDMLYTDGEESLSSWLNVPMPDIRTNVQAYREHARMLSVYVPEAAVRSIADYRLSGYLESIEADILSEKAWWALQRLGRIIDRARFLLRNPQAEEGADEAHTENA